MAEKSSQQRTARLLDSEVGGQFEQRDGDAFVKSEVEKNSSCAAADGTTAANRSREMF
jgi:hypothetical protein